MRLLLPLLLIVITPPLLHAQKRDTIYPGRDLTPLLPYIFFDSGSAAIPARYHQYESLLPASSFSDSMISGEPIVQHREILNIIGYRLRRYPKATITIKGHHTLQPEIGETRDIARQRGQTIYDYLANIWKIDPARITLLPPGDWPQFPSNKRDPKGIVENRRVEVSSDDWEILQPIVIERDGATVACPTVDIYRLILFKFDSPEMGSINERIMKTFVYPGINSGAAVVVHCTLEVLTDYSRSLPKDRAATVSNAIRRSVVPATIGSLSTWPSYVPELHPLPEGRFYSRGVSVYVTRWIPESDCRKDK